MKYKIRYGDYCSDAKIVTVIRYADDACDAIEKLCDQYGWGCAVYMYDSSTSGKAWAQFQYDRNGGINYNGMMTALAEGEGNNDG
jgi:hypothetical protein